MAHHLMAYAESLALVTNDDTNAVVDDVYVQVNNHHIFTDDVYVKWVASLGNTLTRVRFGNATLTQYGSNHIPCVNKASAWGDLPNVYMYPGLGLSLPRDEDIIVETTTDAVGPAVATTLLCVQPKDAITPVPRFGDISLMRATASIAAATTTTWSALANIVLDRTAYTGTYNVLDAFAYGSSGTAFRLRFPDNNVYGNKQLRPGSILHTSTASKRNVKLDTLWDVWGQFHTFSLPQVQVLGNASAFTLELYLVTSYVGRGRM